MRHPVPTPPVLGELEGLAYALFLPSGEPSAGVVILHGAGSAKESHFEFARECRAEGMAALAYDARGHGQSSGSFGPGAIDDALAMVGLLRERCGAVALRGSSMGGFQAILAAEREPSVCAVVAICPAPERGLLRGFREGTLEGFSYDLAALEGWLGEVDLTESVRRLGPDTALLLLHARGDERVPAWVSEKLYEAAREPKQLIVAPGGDHRSVQHDAELGALSRRFIRDAARGR